MVKSCRLHDFEVFFAPVVPSFVQQDGKSDATALNRTPAMQKETEIKLRASRETLEALREHPALKKRILGSHGHLSNAAAANLLSRCLHAGLRTVAAAHLSEHNNTPELARLALAAVLGDDESDVRVAHPTLGLDWVVLN